MNDNNYRPNGFSFLPTIIKNIIIINVLLFLLKIALYDKINFDIDKYLGLHFFLADDFKPYQIISYMFMHGDFTHLLFNMFALWMFGSALENFWGTKKFIIYFLVTGLGAAFFHYLILYYNELRPAIEIINNYINKPDIKEFESTILLITEKIHFNNSMRDLYNEFINTYNTLAWKDNQNITNLSVEFMQQLKTETYNAPNIIGASGAVFGMLLAFGMIFPNTLIYLYFFIPIKAKYFVIIYGALEIYLGVSRNSNDNVAHFAHLGGMIFGYILIKYWDKKKHNY
ncbi:MAG: hypothetical protein A2X12_05205 [Bacteroidetes bacterium GWE2_29_8]|nr:MAG: hypothetical protein A2X12_05205 [Bacteroidetes bacterium GWE2_29_8]OFY15557.1 MAG: hypothetical protein A2X02_04200 [Bacteroidetes bacterium GWF2_29_10]